MKFFFDNNLPPRLARMLDVLVEGTGVEVRHLRDLYPHDTEDSEWIKELSAKGQWVIITCDKLLKDEENVHALQESNLTIFILNKYYCQRQIDIFTKAAKFIKSWPLLEKQARHNLAGGVFHLNTDLKIL